MDNEKELSLIINNASGPIAKNSVRESIQRLEDKLATYPQVEIPVIHRYSGGIYSREITIPAGVILTGKIYMDDHFDVMVYGDVTVSSDDGEKRLNGFHIFPGAQGKKRAGFTHEETRWITFCKCDEMAEDEYIDHLTAESFDLLEHRLEERKYIDESEILKAFRSKPSYRKADYEAFKSGYLAASGLELRISDYDLMLKEYGFTESVVRRQSENLDDQIDIGGDYGVEVRDSDIEGKGLFSIEPFSAGQIIMPASIGGLRTIAGRYVNHAKNPNAVMVLHDNGDFFLEATSDIEGEEITTDYRETLKLQIKKAS